MILMKKKIFVIIIFLILNTLIGCIDFLNNLNEDPVILKANPYIEKIKINNTEIRNYALSIINNSQLNHKEVYINAIYRYIIENFHYFEDPLDTELIKTPEETINDGGGDCEDLTILLNSLLENIGIKTFLVMNETHAYSLVYDVNTSLIWREIEKSFIDLIEDKWGDKIKKNYEKNFVLRANELWYYGGNGSYFNDYVEYINISYNIVSEKPINLYLVPSRSDFENLTNNKPFYQYKEFEEKNILESKNQFLYGDRFGGIILQNERFKETNIYVNISFYLHPYFYEYYKNDSIKTYKINDINCIVLDCTVGEWGYPGYDAGIKGEKIAISPITKEYYYLID
jgi:hypothetical protein